MFANHLHIFLSLALATAVGVSAQTSNLDACILNCINQAVANNTWSFSSVICFLILHPVPGPSHFHNTDISCVCGGSSYQKREAACPQANRTNQGQQTALQLRDQQCISVISPTQFLDLSSAARTGTFTGTNAVLTVGLSVALTASLTTASSVSFGPQGISYIGAIRKAVVGGLTASVAAACWAVLRWTSMDICKSE